jgi:hypothetical protein
MSAEKCAELIVKAAAYDMREVWISTQVCAALLSMLIAVLQCIWVEFLDLMGSLCLLNVLRQGGEFSFSKAGPFDASKILSLVLCLPLLQVLMLSLCP